MNGKKQYVLFLLLSLLFFSCTEINEVEDKPTAENEDVQVIPIIPDEVISKANEFIKSKVGEQFFNSYIKYDSTRSKYSPADSHCVELPSNCPDYLLKPHYNFVYRFRIEGKVFVDEIIVFTTDTLGNVVSDAYGIPVCPDNNCWDNFQLISEDEAIVIAQNKGLEEGLRDWDASFYFYSGDINNYVWGVSNTLYESSQKSGGKIIIINANNGNVIETAAWIIVP